MCSRVGTFYLFETANLNLELAVYMVMRGLELFFRWIWWIFLPYSDSSVYKSDKRTLLIYRWYFISSNIRANILQSEGEYDSSRYIPSRSCYEMNDRPLFWSCREFMSCEADRNYWRISHSAMLGYKLINNWKVCHFALL